MGKLRTDILIREFNRRKNDISGKLIRTAEIHRLGENLITFPDRSPSALDKATSIESVKDFDLTPPLPLTLLRHARNAAMKSLRQQMDNLEASNCPFRHL